MHFPFPDAEQREAIWRRSIPPAAPTADLDYRKLARLSVAGGNVLTEDPEELYFRVTSQKHRDWVRDTQCPTCLSPCQMNVAAVKQVVPYVKFLVRASREKRRSAATGVPAAAGSVSD